MKSFRFLIGLSGAALLLTVVPAAYAQDCPVTRELGGGSAIAAVIPNVTRIRIDLSNAGGSPFTINGNERASFYRLANPSHNSGGPHFPPSEANCPSSGWLETGGMFPGTGFSSIKAILHNVPTCLVGWCAADGEQVVTLYEDVSDDGTDAGFIIYQVDGPNPPGDLSPRFYDHGRTVPGNPHNTIVTHILQPYPRVHVAATAGPPPNTDATSNYQDVLINFHGATGPSNTMLPASAGIQSYDVLFFHGPFSGGPPGRDRGLWSPVKSVPYNNASVVSDMVDVPCPTSGPTTVSWLALGVTFAGGVQSELVSFSGTGQAVSCDPTIADPEHPQHRPSIQRAKPAAPKGR
jgi:hypothetical protein